MTDRRLEQRMPRPLSYAFAAPALPLGAITVTIAVYIAPYYAGPLGLDIGMVGVAFMLVRLIDIPVDFLLGAAMDRTHTRWGRFKVWLLIGAPIACTAVYMLYFGRPGESMRYLMFWLLAVYLGSSILTLALTSWASNLTQTYDDRSRLYGTISAVGVLGSFLVLITPDLLHLAGLHDIVGLHGMGSLILVAVPICVVLAAISTPERPPERLSASEMAFSVREYWSLLNRPSMGRLVAANFFISMGPQWTGALYVFYFTDALGFTPIQTRWLLVLYIFAGFAGAPLIARLATLVGKHRAAMAAIAAWALILASLLVTPKGSVPLGAIQMFAMGFLAAGFELLPRAMTADVADEVELERGAKRVGALFAFNSLMLKLAGSFAIGVSYMVLQAVGYRSGGQNTPDAIHGMVLAYAVGPIGLMLVAATCLRGYPLTKARHAAIRSQLEAREAAPGNGLGGSVMGAADPSVSIAGERI